MGGIFSKPKTPKAPSRNDEAVAEAQRQRRLKVLAGGRAQTVLTKSDGDTSAPNVQSNTLGRG